MIRHFGREFDSPRLHLNSNAKGTAAELAVAADLATRGFTVCLPFGVVPRWDLIFTRDGTSFERVEVKYVTPRKGVLAVKCYSLSNVTGKQVESRPYSQDDVDWIAAYNSETNECFYIPSSELVDGKLSLRIEPTKNNQQQGVRWASEYRSV